MEPLLMELDACRITHAASAACAQRIASAFSRRFYRSHHSDELDKYDDVARFFFDQSRRKDSIKKKEELLTLTRKTTAIEAALKDVAKVLQKSTP